ncbi:protein kinase [Actinoplanes sp. GCM10030250]|uniref:protein kinase n=1 Tax=Actinoplanes sp. GCM10030250 TaxID=3273376 RepID=UPI00366AB168
MAGQEYVDGPDLRGFLAYHGGRLSAAGAAGIAAQVAAELASEHDLGRVHSGLAPQTVLVVPGPGPVRVRVDDSGTVLPMVGYTAPEVLAGAVPTDAADVWSLGVLLVEMVTGNPRGKADDLPSPLNVVARDCLATDSQRRPPARRLAAYLQQVSTTPGLLESTPASGTAPSGTASSGTAPSGTGGGIAGVLGGSTAQAAGSGADVDSAGAAWAIGAGAAPVAAGAWGAADNPRGAADNPWGAGTTPGAWGASASEAPPVAEGARAGWATATDTGSWVVSNGPDATPASRPTTPAPMQPPSMQPPSVTPPPSMQPPSMTPPPSMQPPGEPERERSRWRKGPLVTLGAAVLITAVLAGLNMNASAGERTVQAAQQVSAAPQATTPASLPPTDDLAAPATKAPAEAPGTAASGTAKPAQENLRVTLAGKVENGGGTLALSIRDGKAVAYVCDGDRIESWLQGTATGGKLSLKGRDGSTLTGTFDARSAEGEVTVEKRTNRFEVGVVRKPSGLYRTASRVRGAEVSGGWIVLADGRQVGVLKRNGAPAPAPLLDVATRTATVDGETVSATTIDAESGEGF